MGGQSFFRDVARVLSGDHTPDRPLAASVRRGPGGLQAHRDLFDIIKNAYAEYLRQAEGEVPIMTPERRSLKALEETFDRRFRNFPETRLPVENVRERRKGSLPYGSGRTFYVFGEENGREYLEFYAYHRMGESPRTPPVCAHHLVRTDSMNTPMINMHRNDSIRIEVMNGHAGTIEAGEHDWHGNPGRSPPHTISRLGQYH